jgi:GTP-binding protein HflX
MKDRTRPTQQPTIPVVLVLTVSPQEREQERARDEEMRSLLDTAGRSVVGVSSQHLPKPVGGTYIGSGKVAEVAALVTETGAQQVVFDVELSPRQQQNLEEAIGHQVLDYDELILDIFARNARTHQARLAVQVAQLEYTKSRLRRRWTHLDRLIGGVGVRGPGEKQIEIDRRLIKKRIMDLQARLEEIGARKDRAVRSRDDCFNLALVGYTNAGKSTLMNALTDVGVLAEDRLFATLDTRTAQLHLDGCRNVVLSDTVGFIRNLPPTLIASFHATLAEVREADLLLHVVDSSSANMEDQIAAVEAVLATIGADRVPVIMVFNKIDRCYSKTLLMSFRRRYRHPALISALTGEGLDQLRALITTFIASQTKTVTVRFPVTDGALDAFVRSRVKVSAERYEDDNVVLTIDADERLLEELRRHPHLTVD